MSSLCYLQGSCFKLLETKNLSGVFQEDAICHHWDLTVVEQIGINLLD